MSEEAIYCPIKQGVTCCRKLCMLWVEWADGGECAFHAIAVELNQSEEEVMCEEEEEPERFESQQSKIDDE